MEIHAKQDALAHRRASSEGFFQCGKHFLEGEGGEEARASNVEGKEGDTTRGSHASGGQKRAVTSQNEQEIRFAGEFLASPGGCGLIHRAGCLLVEERANAMRFKPLKKRGDDGRKLLAARGRDDADGFQSGLAWHGRLRFYPWGFFPAWGKNSLLPSA